jgi:hypothetical protein
MRFVMACLFALGLLTSGVVTLPAPVTDSGHVVALAQEVPSGELNVDIDTDGGGAWWANPVWIGIGIVALILLVVIVAMSARGGGTTVIKD